MTDERNLDQQGGSLDQQGTNSGNASDDFSWLDGESEAEYVDRINKETGRNFKNVGDIVKNIQNADKTIETLKSKPQAPVQSQTSPDDLEVLFYGSTPKAGLVKDDLKMLADAKYGGSVLKAWAGETWLQEKAEALDREEKRKAADSKKVLAPSGQPGSSNDYLSMTDEQILDLPPAEAAKAFKVRAGK